jgi:hypothetical protein
MIDAGTFVGVTRILRDGVSNSQRVEHEQTAQAGEEMDRQLREKEQEGRVDSGVGGSITDRQWR